MTGTRLATFAGMFHRKLFPGLLAGLCATTGAIVACSHDRHDTTLPPIGESTAAGPADPTVPPPDSAGVPPDDQPVPQPAPHAMIHRTTELRVAQGDGYATDAGISIAGDAGTGRPIGGTGSGSGSNGPGRLPPGSGSGTGSGTPGQPGLPQPTPGQPTPGQPAPPPTPAPHR